MLNLAQGAAISYKPKWGSERGTVGYGKDEIENMKEPQERLVNDALHFADPSVKMCDSFQMNHKYDSNKMTHIV